MHGATFVRIWWCQQSFGRTTMNRLDGLKEFWTLSKYFSLSDCPHSKEGALFTLHRHPTSEGSEVAKLVGEAAGQVTRWASTCLMSTWLSTCCSTARPSYPSSLATPAISQCWSVARRSWTRWRGTSRSALAEFNTRLHKSLRTVEKSFDQVKCFNKRPEEHCVWMKAFVENCTKGILGKCSEAGFSCRPPR